MRQQAPAWMVGMGHGATHWIAATFYLLIPYMREDLGFSYLEVGLLGSTFHVSSFLANFGSGMVVDVLGKRVAIQFLSLVVGAAALMLFGLAGGLVVLFVLVGLIGATNNLWHPAAISFLSGAFPKNRGYTLSIHTLGATMGDSLAPLCIGALLAVMTWEKSALIGGIPVIVVALLIFTTLVRLDRDPESTTTRRISPADYFRGLRDMFTDKAAMGLCLMAGFRSMAQNGLLVFVPLYLADILGFSPFYIGLSMTAMQIGGLVAGPAAGVVSDRIGRRPVVMMAVTATTLIILLLALANNEIVFIGGVSMLGFALFAMRPVLHSWMMDMTPLEMHGSATSALFVCRS
jgi:sugar phosphate permease